MFALTETALLYACVGQRGGKPAYAETGAKFRCRSEPAWAHKPSGSAVARMADTRIFACAAPGVPIQARPGDRLELNGRRYTITEVQCMRGWSGIHHLEMLARDEGFAGRAGGDA